MKLPKYDWTALRESSERVVEETVASLPCELEQIGNTVPVLMKRWHPNAPHIDPEAMYMLGEYINFGDEESLDSSGTIVLYLGAIAWYCEDEGLDFEDEIRKTFLHELGHHLGWDEDEVDARGLS